METIAEAVMDKHIADFITEQTVMTIATSSNNIPHCAMCFYVFMPQENMIVFKSKSTTTHITQAFQNNSVAGSILPDKFNPGKTSGIQFTGHFRPAKEQLHTACATHYYSKYPFAVVMPGELWVIELSKVVFTDATLGIGKKRNWDRV
jgi:uncharacterized protein